MQLRYNYRAYPVASQRRALAKAFGCARVVWNDCLRDRKEAHAAGLPYVKSAQLSGFASPGPSAPRNAPGSPRCRRAVLSDGRKIDSPRFLRRAEKKLKRLQRELSRKAKGSKNGQGARQEATVVIAAINEWL